MPKVSKTYQPAAWKQQREKHKQVEKWKTVSKYKQLLKREGGAEEPAPWAPSPWDAAGPSHSGDGSASGAAEAPAADTGSKRKKPASAQTLARQGYESKQRDVDAEREDAGRAAEKVRQAKLNAQKKRAEQSVKMKKRTRRGQPVLSNQVDAILQKLGAR